MIHQFLCGYWRHPNVDHVNIDFLSDILLIDDNDALKTLVSSI